MIAARERVIWLLLVAWLLVLVAAKKEPDFSETKFESQPVNVFYFEDSDNVILQDLASHTAYRSDDAGANWKKITDIEGVRSLRIVPNPYNNKVAVAVSTGKEHWITRDQGKSWDKFELDKAPMSSQQPIVFHAADADKLIFLTVACKDLFSDDCTGTVSHVLKNNALSNADHKPGLLLHGWWQVVGHSEEWDCAVRMGKGHGQIHHRP